jgi:ribosomal protein S27E
MVAMSKFVYMQCSRCEKQFRISSVKADRLKRLFGSVWCADCQLVTSIWAGRGGLIADLPLGVEVVLLHAGQVIGPPV